MLNKTAELTRQTAHENMGSDLMHIKVQVEMASNPQSWLQQPSNVIHETNKNRRNSNLNSQPPFKEDYSWLRPFSTLF